MKITILVYECVILLSLLQIKCSCGARILGFFGTISRSHFIVEEPVMRELAKRGHEVKIVIFKDSTARIKMNDVPLGNCSHFVSSIR